MPDHHLDFRSDTAAWPSDEMREAMLRAPVGDDVFDEDPTVHELQNRLARGIAAIDGLDTRPQDADTNLVFFDVAASLGTAAGFVEELVRRGHTLREWIRP